MKLGIIGSGLIVQEFLPLLVKLEGLEVLGILGTLRSMLRTEKLCRENSVPHVCSNFEELYETGIDTVYVAVPNFLHEVYCRQALEKGLHVIVEKPMTSNVREALSLKELAIRKGCFLFEAITTLYLDSYSKVKEWLPRIGDVKIVQSQYSQYSRRYDAFRAGRAQLGTPFFHKGETGDAGKQTI